MQLILSRRRSRIAVLTPVAALAVAALIALPGTGQASPGSRSVRMYIVTLRAGTSPQTFASQQARKDGAQVQHVYRHALLGYAARMSAAAAARLANDPRVLAVMADRPVHIDAQTLPTGINRVDGELSSTVSGNGSGTVNVDVAVIDTGIQTNHPDLTVVGGVNCNTGSSYADGNGHGTHVAGTIAAKDDANGVVGVAPGARLWAVRVLNNSGQGTWSQVICGIDWVTGMASTIEVANMSLGGIGSDNLCGTFVDSLHEAICRSVNAGVTYAVAAGNESDNAANHVPAAYDQVITVSALADFNGLPGGGAAATCRPDVDDTFADFSNYGSDVDIIAPGVCIYSTWKGSTYNTISGTSMATPHVAGAAALYKSTHPTATPAQVRSAIIAAGNQNWFTNTDPDSTHENLLNVDAF